MVLRTGYREMKYAKDYAAASWPDCNYQFSRAWVELPPARRPAKRDEDFDHTADLIVLDWKAKRQPRG